MAVQYEKAKKAPKQKAVAAVVDVQPVPTEVVDEFLTLTTKLKKHDDKVKADRARLAELDKEIRTRATEGLAPEAKIELVGSGSLGRIEISACSESTTITDMKLVREHLGEELFLALAKVNLTDLRDYLTKPQLMQCTKTERGTTRRLKVL